MKHIFYERYDDFVEIDEVAIVPVHSELVVHQRGNYTN